MKDLFKILIRTSKKQHKQNTKQKILNENDSNKGWPNYAYVSRNHNETSSEQEECSAGIRNSTDGGGVRGVNDAVSECPKFHL